MKKDRLAVFLTWWFVFSGILFLVSSIISLLAKENILSETYTSNSLLCMILAILFLKWDEK